MPPQSSKKPVDTTPSPNVLQRMLGGVMSNSTANDWPELNAEFARQGINYPNETAATSRVMQMGPMTRMMHPDAYAVTGPMGTMAFNRELIDRDKQNLSDVMVHELAHVGQGGSGFLRKFYEPNAVENEAVNREAMRNRPRMNDIYLPPEKGVSVGPSKRR